MSAQLDFETTDERLIKLCLECDQENCIGICEAYKAMNQQINPYARQPKWRGKRFYEYRGRRLTAAEWAEEIGISAEAMRKRLRTMTIGEAIAKGKSNGTRQWEAFGRAQSITEWAREFGMNRRTVERRIESGMTLEDALMVKPLPCGPRKEKGCR